MELVDVDDNGNVDFCEVYDTYVRLVVFRNKLTFILFGDNYQERMTLDQLTDEKLLEAVRMLKEVY